jgi:transposase
MPITFYKARACCQATLLLPPRIEDYVGADNATRAIEACVDALDQSRLGFRHADRTLGTGQPPYDPGDLLKLYLYGYLNQIRSSRRLAREAGRNIELMWLLGGLVPGFRTIAKFRAENAAALRQANRDFVLILRKLGLVGGDLVAIDGALFDGNASKASIVTRAAGGTAGSAGRRGRRGCQRDRGGGERDGGVCRGAGCQRRCGDLRGRGGGKVGRPNGGGPNGSGPGGGGAPRPGLGRQTRRSAGPARGSGGGSCATRGERGDAAFAHRP